MEASGAQTWGRELLKKRILIIDDQADCRELLKDVLSDEFQVFEAGNGQEGVDFLNQQRVDLIISDLKMPVQDGRDTILEVRHSFPNIKIIVISGYEQDIQRMKLFKADKSFVKPFNVLEVLEEVKKLLNK